MVRSTRILKQKKPSFLIFHEKTSLSPNNLAQNKDYPQFIMQTQYKEYERFKKIKLPTPLTNNLTVFDALSARRSDRKPGNRPILPREYSSILYFSAGLNINDTFPKVIKRRYPSTGSLYPIEIYPVFFNKKGNIKSGAYHYHVKQHSLEVLTSSVDLASVTSFLTKENTKMVNQNSLLLVFSGVFPRVTTKYRDRSYRYCLLEAGHIIENVYLVAAALNIGCCEIGGFFDEKANELFDFEKEKERVLSMVLLNKRV